MNLVRSILSLFLFALLAVSVAGWVWAGGQPSPQSEGARFVLALCAISSIGCCALLWRARPGSMDHYSTQQKELERASDPV